MISTLPSTSDTLLWRWKRILQAYQNKLGALPENNPYYNDTLRVTRVKVLRAIEKVATGGMCDCSSTVCQCEILVTDGSSPPILTSTLPIAFVNVPYSVTFVPPGCAVAPIQFSLVSGTLPPGLTLNQDTGTLTGSPTGPTGNYCFTIQLIDQAAPPPPTDIDAWWTFEGPVPDGSGSQMYVDSINSIQLDSSNFFAPPYPMQSTPGLKGNALTFVDTGANAGFASQNLEPKLKLTGSGWSLFFWFNVVHWADDPPFGTGWSRPPTLDLKWGPGEVFIQFDPLDNGTGPNKITIDVTDDNFNDYLTTLPISPTVGAWTFFHIFFDPVLTQVGYQLNNGAKVLDPTAGVVFAPNATGFLDLFQSWGSLSSSQVSLQIDELGLKLSGMLTPAEATSLYNAGAGRTCCPIA